MSTESGRRVVPFLVLFEGRTGSTYLMEALSRHPELVARMEVFAAMRSKGYGADGQIEWLREFFGSEPDEAVRAVGFKTKLRDVLDPDATAEALRELRPRLVLLLRRNRVKHLVSVFNAMRLHERTGEWNRYGDGERLPPLRIDPDRFDEWLAARERRREELEAYAAALSLPTLRLEYEDLLEDEEAFLGSVFSFLGVEPRDVEGEARKNTSDDLRRAVANFDELRARYVGTRYEPMFDEVVAPDRERP